MSLRDILRKPFTNTAFAPQVNLSGKQAIVTGCSAGSLGYETAKQLARWGALVIVTTRRDTAAIVAALKDELGKENIKAAIDGLELDVCDAESVNQFTRWYHKNHGERLDILVNNAGVHLDLMSKWKEPKLTADGFEMQWRTNYLGSAHLTHNLLPLLRKTASTFGEARVVNVVSQIHSRGSNQALFDPNVPYNSWRSYGLSKLAMIHNAYEIHRRFGESDNIKAYALHPGSAVGTYSNVADNGFAGSPVINFLRKLGAPIERLFMTTVEEGAQTQIYCATSADAKSGHYYQNCAVHSASPDTQDTKAAARLWEETAGWLDKVSAGA